MADELLKILGAVRTYLADNIEAVTADDIEIAWPDDRVVGGEEITPKKLTLSIYEFGPEPENDWSGAGDSMVKDLDAGTASLTPPPHPFRLGIQVDCFCDLKIDAWNILYQFERVVASALPISVDFGGGDVQTFYPLAAIGDNQDDLTEHGFHSVLRFTIQLWLDDARATQVVALITSALATINLSETIQVQEES